MEAGQNQGKKADSVANQGTKVEGIANQGKKADGTPNQGKKAEGTSNQGKKSTPGSPGESGLVSRGSQGLRSPLESRRGTLGAP